MKYLHYLKYLTVILLTLFISHCGGFKSVKKLPKIEKPKLSGDLQEQLSVKHLPLEKVKKQIPKKEKTKKVVNVTPPPKIAQTNYEKKISTVFDLPHAKMRKEALSKVNPFRAGEKTTLSIKWFAIKAGEIGLEVLPYVSIGGRKSYHFRATARSSAIMNLIHSVNDSVESYVDVETFYPFKSLIHGIETDRLREGLVLFDYVKKKDPLLEEARAHKKTCQRKKAC